MKKTRRAQFLEEMQQLVPWADLYALLESIDQSDLSVLRVSDDHKSGKRSGPVRVERLLRIYFLQQWFNLSDSDVEDALYESSVMCEFVGIHIPEERIPDETAVATFRDLLEQRDLGEKIRARVNRQFQDNGLSVSPGAIVDASVTHSREPL